MRRVTDIELNFPRPKSRRRCAGVMCTVLDGKQREIHELPIDIETATKLFSDPRDIWKFLLKLNTELEVTSGPTVSLLQSVLESEARRLEEFTS